MLSLGLHIFATYILILCYLLLYMCMGVLLVIKITSFQVFSEFDQALQEYFVPGSVEEKVAIIRSAVAHLVSLGCIVTEMSIDIRSVLSALSKPEHPETLLSLLKGLKEEYRDQILLSFDLGLPRGSLC